MSSANNAIKNSFFLYIRLGVSLIVVLYSTRLILASLGEVDFGIFNVIAGGIGLLGFLNGTLANATQRFMSYAEGEGDLLKKIKIFNVSIILHLCIGIITVLLLYSVMGLLFDHVLNIETNRIEAAKMVYWCLIFSTFLTIINVPYEAVLTSHENMLYYTIIGIVESFLKLGIAEICVYYNGDKLICYAVLMALLPMLTLSVMKIYCHHHYKECKIAFRKYWDSSIIKSISSFCGWNILTSVSILMTYQGNGLILNHFFGSILNAAQGVANQVNGQLSALSINMMKAVNPIIIKKSAAVGAQNANIITLSSCKFSTFLILLLAVPFVLEMKQILHLWLTEVPQWTVTFCNMQLLYTVVVQMTAAISTAIYATGRIKNYAIYKSVMNILPIFILYICFLFGCGPVFLYIPMIVFLAIGGDIVILYFAHKECGLILNEYFKVVALPVLGVMCMMVLFGWPIIELFNSSIIRIIGCFIATSMGLLISLMTFGLNQPEKKIFQGLITKVLYKKLKLFKLF